jgi:thioredoxin 1
MSKTARVITTIVVLAAVAGVVALKQREAGSPSDGAIAPDAVAPAPAAALPHLIDLGADKCIPCKAMAPILEALRIDFAGELRVTFIDVWKDIAAGEAYGVTSIPTQIFFDAHGNELFRHMGFYSRKEILDKWRELGYEFQMTATPETDS